MTNPKFGKIISLISAVFIVLTGLGLIFCSMHLFFTGGARPYSRDLVGKYLSYLIIPAAFTALAVIAGKVYDIVTKDKTSDGFKRSEREMLTGYAKRFDLEKLDQKTKDAVVYERDTRFGVKAFFYAISALFAIFALTYLMFYAEFTVEDLSRDVLRALAVSLSFVTASIATLAICATLCEKSAKKERIALLDAVKSGYKPAPPVTEEVTAKEKKKLICARYVILGIAILLVIIGIFNGGMADVLDKAVKICTECIGLG